MKGERDLYVEERILIEKDNDLALEKLQVQRIKDVIEEEQFYSQKLLIDIYETYIDHENNYRLEDMLNDYKKESQKCLIKIEERQMDIHKEERLIQDNLEEIALKKVQFVLKKEEGEEKNEY